SPRTTPPMPPERAASAATSGIPARSPGTRSARWVLSGSPRTFAAIVRSEWIARGRHRPSPSAGGEMPEVRKPPRGSRGAAESSDRRSRRSGRWRYLSLAALLTLVPVGSEAQQSGSGGTSAVSTEAPAGPQLRVYVGMWTVHLRDLGRGLQQNWALGVAW